ncbi:MAG: glycoside hydrolase family 2 protein, partial [Clostridia bacterium]|nr:glycoside hydrolase family 2 protein [Clostridia bacterium]
EPCHIASVFPTAHADGSATVQVQLSQAPAAGDKLRLTLPELGIDLALDAQQENQFSFRTENAVPWAMEEPRLYELAVSLLHEGQETDAQTLRAGFRDAEFRADGFYLNGQRIHLRGLNRHQSWPYIGYAAPAGMQRDEANYLKFGLGLNMVRTSHYPQSQQFIDRCDEIGLLVFTEIPGWQHIGDEDWQRIALEDVRQMVLQYRHHPSIVLWGVRINESQDNDELYTKTNALCRSLDPSRQTGGVRYLQQSHLLEDVYTYNDFTKDGTGYGLLEKGNVTKELDKGYLVTECNGHMYPTKNQDDEQHRLTHALRHAQVQSDGAVREGVAGCIAWCMADYNTHPDFGTGDAICYHGVADGFRNNKLAAWVYASQQEQDPVLMVATDMNKGERAGSLLDDAYVFTNAEKVRLSKGGKFIADFQPDREHFPGLPHPPVHIDDFVGELLKTEEHFSDEVAAKVKKCLFAAQRYGMDKLPLSVKMTLLDLKVRHGFTLEQGIDLFNRYMGGWGQESGLWRFTAIRNGEAAEYVEKGAYTKPRLVAWAERVLLTEGSAYDMTLVHLECRDERGNRIPTAFDPILLTTEGPIQVVGPRAISLEGGAFGTYVRTTGETGEGVLTLSSPTLGSCQLSFTIIPEVK